MPQFRGTEIASLLLALVVVPLVSFMVVMKWKAAAARKSEIRKLLVMAADEAGKVEADAAAEYTNSVSTFNGDHQCAVCLSPTTSRCSKCKAVRYCSGKCQIIHWRQGHKQECQPPVIYNSSASMPCVSSPRSEADSTALFETPGLRSFDHNSEEPRNCATTIRKLDLYGSENPEVCASELTSVLKMGSDVTNDTSDPEIVNMIDSGPCAVMSSIVPSIPISGMHLSSSSSTSVASGKDAPNNDISGCESNVPDVSISHSVSLPSDLGSGVPSSREVNTQHSEILVSDIPPFTKTINVVHDFKSNTLNLPVPKNLTCSPPVSSGSLDNPTALRISEHEVHSSASFAHNLSSSTYQMADLFIPSSSGKSPINSKNPVCDLSVSKSPLQHSSSIRSHMVDPPLSKTSMADICQPDAPSSRSCADNIASAQNSVPHSSCLQASLSSGLSSSSLVNCDGRSSSTCSTTSIFQSSMPNEWNAARSVPEIRTLRTSVLNTTSRRSFGTVQEDSSPCREGDSMLTISSKTSGNLSEESSDAVQIANHTGNGLKRSEKIIALQSKSLKASKQIAGGQKMDNLPKSSKMLFSYEYFVKLFNCDKLELPPCGLINCGNSCYANVVLQCLTYTRPLAAYLLQGCHSEQCQTKDWCFMCELEHLVSRVRGRESPLSPIRILSRIQSIGNHLGYGRQEDAHEFLRFAIDSMQSTCLDEAGGQMAVNPTAHLTTFIQQMFGGYLQSKVKCKQCHHESNRYEVMMDLTVEVQGNIESLEDALAQFTAPELLDGENKYKCDSCKSYVKARKWLTVHEAPNILTIALKRFQTGSFGKLNKLVVFPEVLDMLPYMSGTGDKPPLYKLYAVVVHLDMLNASYFGHYVCYVKDLQGDWYKIDDSKVTPVALDMVMSEGAYMLLYSRSSPRPPAVLKDGIAQTCTTVLVNNCTYDTVQSSLSNGHDEKFGAHATQFPSLDACTADTVDGSHPAIVGISDYDANDVDSCNAVNLDAFHFDHNRISSILGDGDIHLISRGYEDLASSDAGSLFSGSDETSCSTDSNWDSTSIVDNVEAVVGDPKNLPCSSSSVSEFCNASTSMFSRRSSPGPAQRELIFENDAYFLHSSFSNQHLGKRRIGQGLCCVSNPHSLDPDRVPSMPSNSHCLDISPRDRDTLDCRVSNTNKYGCLKSPNFGASKSGDYSNHISNEDFAGPAKRRYKKEKCMTVEESEKLKFHAPSRTHNSAMNFEHYLVHEPRTLAIPTGHFLGFER